MFDPGTSIRFGAYYLGEMVRRFGEDVEYAVAAYNGGPGTVQRTLDYPMVRDRNDFYRWLAKAESREFVNRVMLNHAVYQWLERVEVTE
jgi:soluble lytic murein transglycosylase